MHKNRDLVTGLVLGVILGMHYGVHFEAYKMVLYIGAIVLALPVIQKLVK